MTANLTDLTGTWTIDNTHSRLGFVTRHAMVTKVRGSFNDFQGTVTVPSEGVEGASAEVTITASSIDTRNADRDGHLKSNDFFDMETYPEITFRSTKISANGSGGVDVTGDLTIKGQTRSITVPFDYEGTATDPFGNLRAGFEGTTVINRSDFGLTWNAALETGGVLVSEKVTLEIEVSAIKEA
ncbi:YceI family protein [Dietzia sp. PP-33]|jgi:polyisoprenoid-binding protein YceI|uniref:YceI family protein n=1 Tax=Dietzia sp. PP-33 TaxID=2957500 RepID=UPI0029BC983A|nr:YceI family protein [Dietzia sp. PP-33]MDX2357646.1 YceI family protein [Dietzia sp. PP-33]